MEHAGTTEGGETAGGSSRGGELSPGGGSAEMISDGCPYANRKVLVKGVGEYLLPTAQAWGLWWPGPPVAAPCTRDSHIDLFCHLIPCEALITKLQDLLCGGGMCRRAATTHGDAGPLKLLADRAPRNAQLGTDLAQGPALGVQVGCTLNVHRATVTAVTSHWEVAGARVVCRSWVTERAARRPDSMAPSINPFHPSARSEPANTTRPCGACRAGSTLSWPGRKTDQVPRENSSRTSRGR